MHMCCLSVAMGRCAGRPSPAETGGAGGGGGGAPPPTSPAVAALPPAPERRRPRRGSLERPVNGRLYRGTWLLVGLPLLVLAFSVARPPSLQAPSLPAAFDPAAALAIAHDLALHQPLRTPGTTGSTAAARWFRGQLETPYGYTVQTEAFM